MSRSGLKKRVAATILAFSGITLSGACFASDVLLNILAGAMNQYNYEQLTPEQRERLLQRQYMEQQLQNQRRIQQQLQQIQQNQEQLRQQQEWDQMTRRR